MLELVQDFLNVARHAEIYGSVDVVPLKGDATEHAAGPVLCDCLVVLVECVDEVLCVITVCVLYVEVVHHQGKFDWSC